MKSKLQFILIFMVIFSGCKYLNPLSNFDKHPRENAHVFFLLNNCQKEITVIAKNNLDNSNLHQGTAEKDELHYFWISKEYADIENIVFYIDKSEKRYPLKLKLDQGRYFGAINFDQ